MMKKEGVAILKRTCPNCGKKFDRLLEKIDIGNNEQQFRIKNNENTPVCQDCLQDAFFEIMDTVLGPGKP